MSEFFTQKQQKLREIILKLHRGVATGAVRQEFARLIKDVSPEEIASLENSLMQEGVKPEEIQKLCEVHVEVFEASLKKQKQPARLPGHPVHTYQLENKAARKLLKNITPLLKRLKKRGDTASREEFARELANLRKIELHYQRKEYQLFPKLEAHDFTAPSKVMWGKHDEIRALFKQCEADFLAHNYQALTASFASLASKIKNMIFMEEKILLPTALRKLTEREWVLIRNEEQELGYAWITPGNVWDTGIIQNKAMQAGLERLGQQPETLRQPEQEAAAGTTPAIAGLEEGRLTAEQLNLLLKNLPIDITYVDENDTVLYYSATRERIFPRSPAIIGRKVQNCHPPKSVHVVEEILKDFREKKRKVAEFWLPFNRMFVHIRYFPLYDQAGNYKGVIEVTQDIGAIKELSGEKRLLDGKKEA